MNCRKCGAFIKEGYDFCRKCATPIEDIGDIVVPDIVINNQTNVKTNNLNKIKEMSNNFFSKKDTNNNEPLENKDIILKEQNNMKKATLDNVLSALLVIAVLIVFFMIIYKVITNL